MFQQALPLQANRQGHLRKPVAGQVDQCRAVLHAKQVDQLGPARCLGNEGEPGVPYKSIDRTGLSRIRAAGEGDLRTLRRRQTAGLGYGNFEGGVAE